MKKILIAALALFATASVSADELEFHFHTEVAQTCGVKSGNYDDLGDLVFRGEKPSDYASFEIVTNGSTEKVSIDVVEIENGTRLIGGGQSGIDVLTRDGQILGEGAATEVLANQVIELYAQAYDSRTRAEAGHQYVDAELEINCGNGDWDFDHDEDDD